MSSLHSYLSIPRFPEFATRVEKPGELHVPISRYTVLLKCSDERLELKCAFEPCTKAWPGGMSLSACGS